jgi:hypothetical protein
MIMANIDYRGLSAVIIAAALGLALVIGVSELAFTHRILGEAGSEVLIAVGGALVGALAGYIGGANNRNEKDG